MKEYAIGQIFDFNGIKYVTVKQKDVYCDECTFFEEILEGECENLKCAASERSDKTNVIFVKA